MSERGRVALIFGAIGALALGGGYYYFGMFRPKEVKRAAQAEVASWEQRWTAARACLLGKAPGSPRTSEALAIHELSSDPDPWDKSTCTPLMAHLARGDAPDTGLTEVEAAWRELDHAASRAAQAFAEHAAQEKAPNTAPLAITKDPLPGALDALDAARSSLRLSVGLADDAAHGGPPPLPAAEVIPLAAGSDPVARLDVVSRMSAHGFHAFGKSKSGVDVQLDVPFAGKPSVAHVPPNGLRALPDGSWGAAVAGGSLAIGAIDGNGGIGAPIANAAKDVTAVVAALGTLADGTVLYSTDAGFGIAHVKSGAVTLEPTTPAANGDAAVDIDGRAMAWWVAPGASGTTYVRTFGLGATQAVPIASTGNTTGCLSADRAWLFSGNDLTAVGAGSAAEVTLHLPETIVGLDHCSAAGAVVSGFVTDDDPNHQLCTDACRPLSFARGVPAEHIAVAGGQLVGVTLKGPLLAVWRGTSATPAYYAVPGEAGAIVTHVFGDGASLDVVLASDQVALVRVPLQ